jgi:hypothetical protein
MDKQKIIDSLELGVRNITRFFFRWLSEDGEVLGYILAVIHSLGTIAIWECILFSHTVFIDLHFQIFVFILLLLCWLQHIFLDVCVISVAEGVFTSSEPPSFIILNFAYNLVFGEHNEPLKMLVLLESGLLSGLALELLAKYITLNKALSTT